MSYLQVLRKRFIVVTIEKAANNFAFYNKKYDISSVLPEFGLSNPKSKTYSKATHFVKEIIQANIN